MGKISTVFELADRAQITALRPRPQHDAHVAAFERQQAIRQDEWERRRVEEMREGRYPFVRRYF